MKIVTFLLKKVTTQNGLLIFSRKKTHSETKSKKSSRILRVKPNFFIFSFQHFSSFFFFPFLHFFVFFIFFIFSFSSFFFFFLQFSSFFFFFLFFFFFFSGLLEIASRFLVTFLKKKNIFLSRLGWFLFGPSFHFFSRLSFCIFFSFSFF